MEVGSGGRRSEVDSGGRRRRRRSVAEVGGVKKVSMCSRNIKKHLPVAEVGGGRSRRSVEVHRGGWWRSVAEVGCRRSVAEVGGVKKVSMCSRNIKNICR